LTARDISATVINARFAKPLDETMIIQTAARHRLVVTVEENALSGGFGQHVLGVLANKGIEREALILGLPDGFIEHGAIDKLLDDLGLSPEKIADAIEERLIHTEESHAVASGNGNGKILKGIKKVFMSRINGVNGKT
jgi:1-deoxy-D-xylulose-5-phosphate synthase